ncbi:MAG: alpha/beta hydrolase [Methanothrix sp.]|nr:alpha/beta hydrolase [Methanothrix sp.]
MLNTASNTTGEQTFTRNEEIHGLTSAVWIPPDGNPVGVALVLPGLNLKPDRMGALARVLTDKGVLVLLGSLTGHLGGRELLDTVSPETWISDCLSLYESALEESKRYEVPIFFVGHSLGCLAVLDAMERYERVRFDRLVLFAPAVTPRPFARAARLLGNNFIVPSKTPEEYRVHNGIPAAAYHALLKLSRHLHASGYRRINEPALVFIDKRDELIGYRPLLALTKTRLTRWRIITVDSEKSRLPRSYHHLIIDEDSVGTEQWRSIREEVAEFIR